ncbi:serine/threonine protein kinase [Inquilinus sp. KBS0705]|nr:serine/threonine protein kinase [Inquilinus sp. KBS0705]
MSKVFTITEGLENLGALKTGGQGSVYKGRRMGPIYSAIKLIPTPVQSESDEDKNYRSFKNEVTKLQKVNEDPSPNVVKIFSWGVTESGSFPFIEMEYIEGPDLCDLLHPPHVKIFEIKEVIRLAEQLANALAHCHKVGVKHGDVKSNNVKYNQYTGNYVLLDFGLAIMTEEQRRTSIRHAGAIEFMAPEQHEGKMLLQTDVYSYGVILYELLTGEVPFPLQGKGDAGRNAVMVAHMETEVPDVLPARKAMLPDSWSDDKKAMEMQVPAWLLQIIAKCLEKKPEHRFDSGIELYDAVLNGSLRSETLDQKGGLSKAALRNENERLHAELLKYQQAEIATPEQVNDEGRVSLSKPYYYTLIVMILLFMGFSVYATFFKNQGKGAPAITDSLANKKDTTVADTPTRYDAGLQNEKPAVDSAKIKRDSIAAAKKLIPEPLPDSADTQADTTKAN